MGASGPEQRIPTEGENVWEGLGKRQACIVARAAGALGGVGTSEGGVGRMNTKPRLLGTGYPFLLSRVDVTF